MNLVESVYASRAQFAAKSGRLSHYDSEDALQEAAIDAWQYKAEVANVHQMANTLVRHAYLTAITRETRMKRGAGCVQQMPVTVTGKAYDPSGEVTDPLAVLCDMESAEELWAVVATLAPTQAQAIRLRFIDGLTYQEVADAMGVSLQACGGYLKRGLETLRDRLA